MAARLNGLLNPILRSHKVYASSQNYTTTLEGFFDRCGVEDAPLADYKNGRVDKQSSYPRVRVMSQQEQLNKDRKIYIITPKKVDGVVQ